MLKIWQQIVFSGKKYHNIQTNYLRHCSEIHFSAMLCSKHTEGLHQASHREEQEADTLVWEHFVKSCYLQRGFSVDSKMWGWYFTLCDVCLMNMSVCYPLPVYWTQLTYLEVAKDYTARISWVSMDVYFQRAPPSCYMKLPHLLTTSFLTRASLSVTISLSSAMICRSSGRLSLFLNFSSVPSNLDT